MSLERGGYDVNIAMHEDDLVLVVEALEEWSVRARGYAPDEDRERASRIRVRVQDALVKCRRRKARASRQGRTR